MEANREPELEPIVYELWSEEDLRWIEIPCASLELAAFLEAWCEKNRSIFRRRPFGSLPLRTRREAEAAGRPADGQGQIRFRSAS